MSTDTVNFANWLNAKLRELNTDESVFGSYIIGILEGEEIEEEKKEALESVLAAIIEDDIDSVISDIINRWNDSHKKPNVESKVIDDVETKLAKLLENKLITTTVQRQYTPEELRIREQILSQYSTVEFDDEYDENEASGTGGGGGSGGGVGGASTDDPLLTKNTNAHDVAQLAKQRREQAKIDSKAKKDKDKEDREKQKQLREEKKEKRKTVKGERRR